MRNFSEMTKAQMLATAAEFYPDVETKKLNATDLRAALVAAEDKRIFGFTVPEGKEIHDCDCPHCGIHLSNGVLTPDDEALTEGGMSSGKTLLETGQLLHQFECMGCGEVFGAPVAQPAKQVDRHTGTGLSIEKDRPKQNGVTRPSIGGACRAVWDYLDGVYAERMPTAADVKAQAEASGWNVNNASIEFYAWRKFNGIKGRQVAPKQPAAPAEQPKGE